MFHLKHIVKVTVQTVAQRAQVSIGTVSRVLNEDPTVGLDLSKRVRQSIDDLGYKPLRRRRTRPAAAEGLEGKTLGLLTLGMDRSLSRLPVVSAAIDGIREVAFEEGAHLQIVDVPDPAVFPNGLKAQRFDGWIIKGAMQGDVWKAVHPELKSRLETQPCVWFHGRPEGAPGWSAGVDDWEAGALAARYFKDLGHTRVAFLSPKQDHILLKRRQHGFVSTCEELGLKCAVMAKNLESWNFPLERPNSLAAVNSLLEELLREPNQPSAIFVPADSVAVLLYRALAERGLNVPEDVSVISVNREEGLIAGLFPSLTTVDIHSEEIGREAVRVLGRLLIADSEASRQDLQIAPQLVPGDSVKLF
ncbi:MAG: LacI family DNA-binding transcriptional regulator [Verrucomicrobiota bacterium]